MGERYKKGLVSVIVPCYNHEKYIKKSLLSVLQQSYPSFELIVIDDGSSDSSYSVIQELGLTHNFIHERRTNHGISATLNYAISKYSHGDYICCLASDDYWPPNKLEIQVAAMEKENAAMSFGRALVFEEEGVPLYILPDVRKASTLSFEDLLWQNIIPAPTVMVKRDVFFSVGCYDEKLAIEDWDLWLKIYKNNHVIFINNDLAYYRLHPNNSFKNIEKMYVAKLQILEKYKNIPKHSQRLKGLYYERLWMYTESDKKKVWKELFSKDSLIKWYDLYLYRLVKKLLF